MRYQLCRAALALLLLNVALSQQAADNQKKASPGLCSKAVTQIEITNCWEDLAQKADTRLTTVYQKLQKAMRAKIAAEKGGPLEGYQQRALTKLRAAQLAWTRYREAECDAEEQQNEGGTIAPSIHAGCVKELAERRLDDLQKTYAIYLSNFMTRAASPATTQAGAADPIVRWSPAAHLSNSGEYWLRMLNAHALLSAVPAIYTFRLRVRAWRSNENPIP